MNVGFGRSFGYVSFLAGFFVLKRMETAYKLFQELFLFWMERSDAVNGYRPGRSSLSSALSRADIRRVGHKKDE